jgi:hypothetical protein
MKRAIGATLDRSAGQATQKRDLRGNDRHLHGGRRLSNERSGPDLCLPTPPDALSFCDKLSLPHGLP